MTTFAKGRRARHLPLPDHRHVKPVEAFDPAEFADPPAPEILGLARALARGLARSHHAAEFGDGTEGD